MIKNSNPIIKKAQEIYTKNKEETKRQNKRSFSEFTMDNENSDNENSDDDYDDDNNGDDNEFKFTTKTTKTADDNTIKISRGAKKYLKGKVVKATGIKNPALKSRVYNINQQKIESAKSLARSEILLESERGFIEAEEGEHTYQYTQSEIVKNVDIQSSAKVFDLNLTPNGPFSIDFSNEGRFLLLAGEKGHFSVIDWQRGKKITERHLYKPIRDACFLHNETMFALAQKKFTYIYDKNGVELHCLQNHQDPLFLEFLDYHFLLVSASQHGQLLYEDVSIGKNVANIHFTKQLSALAKNPYNAVINLGYESGIVEMFIPNTDKPVVKVLCHKSPINALAVNITGNYMVTGGADSMVKVFDLRNTYKELHAFRTKSTVKSIAISDQNVLSVATLGGKNQTILWKDPFSTAESEPYLIHRTLTSVKQMQFCPFEDILGFGTESGYSSILVPGSGQANYDSNEADPYATAKARAEKEVTALLEKIPYTMITLDPNIIGTVHKEVKTEEEKFKRKDRVITDKNRIPIDPVKLETMKKESKERKEKKQKEVLDGTHRSALSRFNKNSSK